MPAPTSYTEAELAAYMVSTLDSVAGVLGLTVASSSIVTGVTAVERLLGVTNVATVTDMPTLESAARWKAWQAARTAAAGKFDVKAGSADVKLSQLYKQIDTNLADAESEWFVAWAAYQEANGLAPSFFAFSMAPGCRGR